MITRQTLGVPGFLGAILLLIWAVGFLLLGMHGIYHVLVPVALVLIIFQGVRRVDTD